MRDPSRCRFRSVRPRSQTARCATGSPVCCQRGRSALAIHPTRKYQLADGGPSLRAIAQVISNHGGDVDALLRQGVFTVVIGNADWHGKNVSITFDDEDRIAVAPIYDAMSTRFYETTTTGTAVARRLGMHVDHLDDIDEVRSHHLVNGGRSWGMTGRRATSIVDDTVQRIRAALDVVDAPLSDLRRLIFHRIDVLAGP
jgi:serine/threonine-protein kinase HipA